MKLNIGAGTDIKTGWVNLDIAQLPGIDVVHNLNQFPWPFANGEFEEILANDVLEHLDNFIGAMNELHRITKPGGLITVQVPYWNSWSRHTDPTHRNSFTEDTFRFFDPNEKLCQMRPYYSPARFHIRDEAFIVTPFLPTIPLPRLSYFEIRNPFGKKVLKFFAGFLCNIIQDLHYVLEKAKPS